MRCHRTVKPSSSLSKSSRSASGVTSRPVSPVPPVLMITSTPGSSIHCRACRWMPATSSRTSALARSSCPAARMRSASKSPDVSLLASRESEMVSTAMPNAVNARSVSILPPGMVDSPLAQFLAHDLVYRFALGGAKVDQLFQLGGRSFGEGAVLEGGRIDVDVQGRAAQSGESRQHADAAVADDVEISVLAGAPREHDHFGTDACAIERRFGGAAQAGLDRGGARRLVLVRRFGQLVCRHDAVEGVDI